MDYHLNVLESIKKGVKTLPDEPSAIVEANLTITEQNKIKFKEKYS